MHPLSLQKTISRTRLKKSDLDILGVTFVSKMTFETQFSEQLLKGLVSRGSLDEYLMIVLLRDAFSVLSCPLLLQCSAVWCWAIDTP